MKALKILNTILEFGSTTEKEVKQAIAEIEALNHRKCQDCKKQNTFMCPVTSFDRNIEDFSCNRWEQK